MWLLLLACAPDADPASGCREWEQEVAFEVSAETDACPDPADVPPEEVLRWEACDGDEVLEVVASASAAPVACTLLNCGWSCTYRARVRSCVDEPAECWAA